MSTWEVEFHPACEAWADRLSQKDSEALLAAIRVLRAEGPSLGRPLVDSVKASRHKNMKELRPGSTGRSEIRVLSLSTARDKRFCWSAVTRVATGKGGIERTSRSRMRGSRIINER